MTPPRVLIVEDERIIAKGIEKRLMGMGYAVAGLACSGIEAIRMVAEVSPDVILMDISLGGGMDGVEAARVIRKVLDVPVIYLTAYSDPDTLQRAKLTEPHGYVIKPYEDVDLKTAIEIGLYKHKLDRRLRENEQWLAATLGSIGDGVIATDEHGRIRFLNTLAQQLTGWTQAAAVDRDVQEVFHIVDAKTRDPVPNPILAALATSEAATLPADTILIDKAGNELPIDDSTAPIRDLDGRMAGAVLVFRDITERRRLEEHLRQAQRLEAIGRLAGGIAHDFNNIMTIVLGFSDMLLSSTDGTMDREALQAIRDAGLRAKSLTQQIMAFSRKQMLILSAVNLNTVVRDIGVMVRRLLGSNIEFVIETESDLGRVLADPTQLGQVILNLAANARDAMPMPGGGRLVMSTANVELDEKTTRLPPDVKPGRYVVLSVKDNGVGMTEDVMAHMFEPFFTTKGAGQGTGLGLATVHGIVKQSGGHIEVASKVGGGTTVHVYLPLVEEEPPPSAHSTPRVPARGHETILLVEDEDLIRQMTKKSLQQNGYVVLVASNGLQGLEVAQNYPGQIDLLLTDVMMPLLSGPELAQRLSTLRPSMRVMFMSGYAGEVNSNPDQQVSANYLRKPFRLGDLTKKVREILDSP